MVGYTEVLQTMAAMIIFSMILLNANRMIQRNTVMQVEGELEQEVVALAQDIIEEGRTKEFDELSQEEIPPEDIPNDFTDASKLGGDNESADSENSNTDDDKDSDGKYQRHEFDDFDDYHDWTDTLEVEKVQYYIRTEVFYVDPNTYKKLTDGTKSTFKKMKVNITSDYLKKNNSDEYTQYYLEFIRNYYAD